MSKKINDLLWEKAKKLAESAYDIVYSEYTLTNGDKVFVAENPEFSGLMAQGQTPEEAIEELNKARISFIYFMLVDGLDVPGTGALFRGMYVTTGTGNQTTIEYIEKSGVLSDSIIADEDSSEERSRRIASFSMVTA